MLPNGSKTSLYTRKKSDGSIRRSVYITLPQFQLCKRKYLIISKVEHEILIHQIKKGWNHKKKYILRFHCFDLHIIQVSDKSYIVLTST